MTHAQTAPTPILIRRPLHNRTAGNRSTWIAGSCPVRTVSTSHNHKPLQDFQHKTLQAMQPQGKSASNHSSTYTLCLLFSTHASADSAKHATASLHQHTDTHSPNPTAQNLNFEFEPAVLRGQPCGQHSAPDPQTRSERDDTHDRPTPPGHHCTGHTLLNAEQKMPRQQSCSSMRTANKHSYTPYTLLGTRKEEKDAQAAAAIAAAGCSHRR